MTWNPDLLLEDFRRVAGMAGVSLALDAIAIERCPAPHVPPKALPPGTMAVYVFSFGPHVLKVGKVGPNSAARYTAQHYNAGSAKSTLAASLIKHGERIGVAGLNETMRMALLGLTALWGASLAWKMDERQRTAEPRWACCWLHCCRLQRGACSFCLVIADAHQRINPDPRRSRDARH